MFPFWMPIAFPFSMPITTGAGVANPDISQCGLAPASSLLRRLHSRRGTPNPPLRADRPLTPTTAEAANFMLDRG